jgi:hypothetical protein
MELDDYWLLAGFEIFGNENAYFNFVVSDLFERGAVDVKAVKASFWCSIVQWSHV